MMIQKHRCATCIYRKDSPLDLKQLEDAVSDHRGGFSGYRACHHARNGNVCCRGFWDHHRGEFALGQIAQRLGAVRFVVIDDFPDVRREI